MHVRFWISYHFPIYRGRNNGWYVVWWILFLLLLASSASTGLQHSPNHVPTIISPSVLFHCISLHFFSIIAVAICFGGGWLDAHTIIILPYTYSLLNSKPLLSQEMWGDNNLQQCNASCWSYTPFWGETVQTLRHFQMHRFEIMIWEIQEPKYTAPARIA